MRRKRSGQPQPRRGRTQRRWRSLLARAPIRLDGQLFVIQDIDMFAALVGGLLIGSAVGLLFLVRGRIAGIGGVFGGLVTGAGWREDLLHKALFVFGLVA